MRPQITSSQIKNTVRESYNKCADEFLAWTQNVRVEERDKYTAYVLKNLQPGAHILELGCGAGLPTTRTLAEHFHITGVDISQSQIKRAKKNVRDAQFICQDMTQVTFSAGTFDAVISFYALIHVPREEQTQLLKNIQTWLRPDGLFVASFCGTPQQAGYEHDWLGAPMYWSGFDKKTNEEMVEKAGFHVLSSIEETACEDGESIAFLWIIGQRHE